MDKIAVLIPCYNESATIAKVVEDYKKALPEAVIYVYDNNSTDGTAEIASQSGAVVRHFGLYLEAFTQNREMFNELITESSISCHNIPDMAIE